MGSAMAGLLDKAKTASNDEPKSSKKSESKAESANPVSYTHLTLPTKA